MAPARGSEMVVYYEGTTVFVTGDVFESGWPTPQRFLVADLRDVQVSKSSVDRRRLLNRRTWELTATYHGYQVALFSTTDVRIFGQVKRALVRALEANVR